MKRLSRLTQIIVLAGLLFSPAEGICLLPFPHVALDAETHDSSIESGTFRYQKSIRRMEKDPGERTGKVSERESADSGPGYPASDRFLFRLAYKIGIEVDLGTLPFVKSHFLSAHNTRPPPLA